MLTDLVGLSTDAERARACWYLLLAVDASRPVAAKEGTIRKVLEAASFPLTGLELRREIDFLEKSRLVGVDKNAELDEWFIELTAEGIRFVRYSAPDIPGIERPKRRG
jgi:hypothetical protein